MGQITQTFANGIMLGSIYSIVAVGLALVFGVMDIPQFAFGAHAMIGAYITWLIADASGSYWIAVVVAVIALGFLGVLTQVAIFDPLRKAPPATMFIAAFGLVMVLQGFASVIWGADARRVTSAASGSFTFFGASITYQRLIIVIVSAALFIAMFVFLKRTRTGISIRAAAESAVGATVVGLRPRAISLLAMSIGSALAGLAGALLAPVSQVTPTMGDSLSIKAFVVIILAGMGSIGGAIVGGLVLGLVEAFGSGYISLDWRDGFAVFVLIAILALRPEGLFGKETKAWR
ncbi:amino acid/amide ABC transporter membrane protein 1 (HAAT family) [Antricoccus suffuscus]|uniref:Amino acid/amide ABC transporter membrane protein 1 (HAAT family) n=1 Tax=Antricoccus suffuscus TaxID=1629062 RepID=A0A2T1A205_9ACTN|nr:branched-chain amino acid ABC transporter permease [Antricoccus suffuscus]PRZ42527.1 amino acid/amide ABC transporter membrane protein 1 (HAAT family) [Antricoccus suffuscus]